ncbi:MAG: peptidyl-prolyl cis-trans isomerase [Planctomycetota bacterium]
MRKALALIALAAATAVVPTPVTAEPIATIGKASVDRDAFVETLIEANGLNLLMNMMVMRMAEQQAIDAGTRVTEEEIAAERRQTLTLMFEQGDELTDEQRESLLAQFLERENASVAEFDIVLRTNAYLRAVARPALRDQITDEILLRAFNVQYGEKIAVRHIALPNLDEVRKAQARLDEGEDFAEVASDLSVNPRTAALGGEMPPFTRQSLGLPDAFKTVAFDLQIGEVSEPVQADDAFHLIKLERRIEPQLVKFEDVKDALREQIADGYLQTQIVSMRRKLAERAIAEARIAHPYLAEQLEAQRAALTPQPLDRADLEERFDAQRPEQPSTQPSTQPAEGESDIDPSLLPAVPGE